MKKNMSVKVYLEYSNYWGEITDSELIAQFKNIEWAKNFIKEVKKNIESSSVLDANDTTHGESGWRVRIEEN